MPIALILGLIPTLVSTVEGLFPAPKAGSDKKAAVQTILGSLYDTFLASKIPAVAGLDEKATFLNLTSILIDKFVPSLT